MKIICSKDKLFSGIQIVNRAVSSRSTIPTLTGILFSAEEDRLILTSTDMEIGMEYSIQADISEEGKVVIPARYITDIVRMLPEQEISLTSDQNNRINITCGQAFFDIQGMPSDEFPVISDMEEKSRCSLPQKVLSELIRYTAFAASKDEARINLTGVLFLVENNELEMVATDGHRLATKKVVLGEEESIGEYNVLIPSRALAELNRLPLEEEKEIEIVFGENQIMFKMGEVILISRLIEAEFPNYRQVIPTDSTIRIVGKVSEFLAVLERVSLLAKRDSNVVILHLGEDTLTVTSSDPDIGQAKDIIGVEKEGEELEIAFDARLIIDVLRVMEAEKFAFELAEPLKPGVIKIFDDESYTCVVMPVRISS